MFIPDICIFLFIFIFQVSKKIESKALQNTGLRMAKHVLKTVAVTGKKTRKLQRGRRFEATSSLLLAKQPAMPDVVHRGESSFPVT